MYEIDITTLLRAALILDKAKKAGMVQPEWLDSIDATIDLLLAIKPDETILALQ